MRERHYLTSLFEPKSVAIIGASQRPGSIGAELVRNMQGAGFHGALYAINPNHKQIFGIPSYRSIEDVPQCPDLAVITTKAASVPAIIESCGRAGVKSVVVISAGFGEAGAEGVALEQLVVASARRHNIRLIGPNCLGIMRPAIKLNATFSSGTVIPGSIGFVSQSGALCSAVLDWAQSNNVGFSSVISLGSASDVDFGEILDFLAVDPRTDNIFLYIENIRQVRGFMSALRAAARAKPVLVFKVGRHDSASPLGLPHVGALEAADKVFDAALNRAGVIRLTNIGQLYATASALFSNFRPRGNRLAIITNGRGPGIIARDRAADLGVALANLSAETIQKLDAGLPPNWSHENPIDIIDDADSNRFHTALSACLTDDNIDGVLIIFSSQAMTDPLEVAKRIVAAAKCSSKPMITCWMGADKVRTSRRLFVDASIPTFHNPEPAVEMFSQISAFFRNQKLLMQTPGSLSHRVEPHIESAQGVISKALTEDRDVLNVHETNALLDAFHIPATATALAHSSAAAAALAEEIGFPVTMRGVSSSKTQTPGFSRLNVSTAALVQAAYQEISDHAHQVNATIDGVAITSVISNANGRELMIGVTHDTVFGPIITLGAGGHGVGVQKVRGVALPPLNDFLAKDLIRSTDILELLHESGQQPPANLDALESILLRVSEMVCELPSLRELEINPLVLDQHGAWAVNTRIVLQAVPATQPRYSHMAIHPYPSHLVSSHKLINSKELLIRPIRPEDVTMSQQFVRTLSQDSRYFRFMVPLRELPKSMLAFLTQIDYDREMALVAVMLEDDQEIEVAECCYLANPDGKSCEFALVVGDSWQKLGIAGKLMDALIQCARAKGLKYMVGDVLADNERMSRLMTKLGFAMTFNYEDPSVMNFRLTLNP